MKVRSILSLLLVIAVAVPLLADDEKKQKRKKAAAARKARAAVNVPAGIELTDEQKETVAALNKEYGPKFSELRQKLSNVMTSEQRKARAEAFKAAREAGKTGQELREAVKAAVNLSEEQQKALDDVRAAFAAVNREVRGKLMELLTDEQKAQLRKSRTKRTKKPSDSKKTAEKKSES